MEGGFWGPVRGPGSHGSGPGEMVGAWVGLVWEQGGASVPRKILENLEASNGLVGCKRRGCPATGERFHGAGWET